jgi:hypothetical protein
LIIPQEDLRDIKAVVHDRGVAFKNEGLMEGYHPMRIAIDGMKHTVHTEQGLSGATRDMTDRKIRAIAATTFEILPNVDDVSSK